MPSKLNRIIKGTYRFKAFSCGGDSDYVEVESDGTVKNTGESTVWEDLRFPVQNMKVAGEKQPTWTAYKGGQVLAFADQAVAGNEETAYFLAQIPHSYKVGSNIEVHVHWAGQDTTAAVVRWGLTYSWASIYGAFPSESTVYANGTNSTTAGYHNLTTFGELTGTGKGISSILICSIFRNSSNSADTYSSKSAYLLEVDFHYESDTTGSRQQFVK